jgi:hypothetical protein
MARTADGATRPTSQPATGPANQVVTSPEQLDRDERLGRLEGMFLWIQGHPKAPESKHLVGDVLMFRADLRPGQWAERAAVSLAAVTGKDFGVDFDAWSRWYATVHDQAEWSPSPIPLSQRPREPNEQKRRPFAIAYSPRITREKAMTWGLAGPCEFHCSEANFHVWSEKPLHLKLHDWDGHLNVEGEFTAIAGTVNIETRNGKLDLNGLELVVMDLEALRRVEQRTDDQLLRQDDPQKLMDYIYAEARLGNFLPMAKWHLRSESGRLEAKDPEKRRDTIRELQLDPAMAAKMSAEEIAIEELRREEYASVLQTTRIKVKRTDSTHADWEAEGAHKSSDGKLIFTPDGWAPNK